MGLSDKEIEEKIEKTVYKLEKYYKIYNFLYKIKKSLDKFKEFLIKNFLIFLVVYTILLYFVFRSL